MNRKVIVLFFATLVLVIFPAADAAAQDLPDRLIVGYWHNWMYSPNAFELSSIPEAYNVINIAFAVPTTYGGATMTFTPDPGIYPNPQDFINDVAQLQSRGKKVLISIGGANDPVKIHNATDMQNFVSSMTNLINAYGFDGMDIDLEGASLSLQPGDGDFRSPTSPLIVNFIDAVIQLTNLFTTDFILTAAPETAFVQGGYGQYVGLWGAYLPVIHALRDRLTYIHVQHYNTGSMFGRDGNLYNSGTADFHVAMADSLLAGFNVDVWGRNIFFDPLDRDQVVIGLPASPSAAGSGYTSPLVVQEALDYIYLGIPFGGQYQLADPDGYLAFRGLMTWSINWDVDNGNLFSGSHRPYLDNLPHPGFLAADSATFPGSAGGTINFALTAGARNANRSYLLTASISGTTPGTLLPGGLVTIPLNRDMFTDFVLARLNTYTFTEFRGTLDGSGNGAARLNAPPLPAWIGTTMQYAFATALPWDSASNAVAIEIVP